MLLLVCSFRQLVLSHSSLSRYHTFMANVKSKIPIRHSFALYLNITQLVFQDVTLNVPAAHVWMKASVWNITHITGVTVPIHHLEAGTVAEVGPTCGWGWRVGLGRRGSCVCVCVCACVRACVHACVCARPCVHAYVCAYTPFRGWDCGSGRKCVTYEKINS
jgi:hypothetical protein